MLTKVLALGLLCCAFVPLLRAGTRNSPQITINKDPQAIAVVQSALTAMGGTAAYQDSVANGTSNEDGVSTPVVFKSLGTQLFRADYAVTGGTTSYILNQGIAVLQKFDGTVRSLSTANTFGQRVIHVPVGSLLAGYGDSNVELSYSGTTQLNGSTADIITMDVVDINDGSTADYWRSTTKTIFYLDHSSGFLLQVQYLTFAENDPSNPDQILIAFSNYQTISGVAVPFHQMTYDNGALESDLVINSVSLNVGLSASTSQYHSEVREYVLPKF